MCEQNATPTVILSAAKDLAAGRERRTMWAVAFEDGPPTSNRPRRIG
jgi:hypothetical protein